MLSWIFEIILRSFMINIENMHDNYCKYLRPLSWLFVILSRIFEMFLNICDVSWVINNHNGSWRFTIKSRIFVIICFFWCPIQASVLSWLFYLLVDRTICKQSHVLTSQYCQSIISIISRKCFTLIGSL